MRALPRITCRLALLTLAGCAGEASPLVPVEGTVTMEGQPVTEAVVTFTPIGHTLGNGALGGVDQAGHFSLTDVRGGEGAHPGTYRISIYPTPVGQGGTSNPADTVSIGHQSIPPIYHNSKHTPLQVDVGADGAVVDVMLTPTGNGAQAVAKQRP